MVRETRTAMGLVPILVACACARTPTPAPAGSSSAPKATPPAPLVSAPVVAARASARAVVTAPSYACTELPLLDYYQAGGAVLEQSPSHLKLHLLINLHALDCPAPDATGHNLEVDLVVEGEGEHCWVRGGSVKATPFGLEYEPQKAWHDELRPDGAVDLAAVDPSDAVLRAVTTPRALVLTPDDYWLFEDVKPGAPLYPRLQGEDDQSCCYGFTGAATQHWEYEYAPQFSVAHAPSDETERTRFNVWATRSGLRHRLGLLVRHGFDLRASDRVAIELAGTGQPMAATARVTALNRNDELVSAVLQFSRKPCATCIDGVSGWWLWKATGSEPRD
jgi:hypothetical protein